MKDLQFPSDSRILKKIREGGYYYIDKTNLISNFLAEVSLK